MKPFRISILILLLMSGVLLISSFRPFLPFQVEVWKAPPTADNLKNPVAVTEENILAGKKIFEGICWTCHGLDGKGNGPASVQLIPKPADFSKTLVQSQSDGALFYKISVGKGAMVPFSQSFTPLQRWQLVCYLRQFQSENYNISTQEIK